MPRMSPFGIQNKTSAPGPQSNKYNQILSMSPSSGWTSEDWNKYIDFNANEIADYELGDYSTLPKWLPQYKQYANRLAMLQEEKQNRLNAYDRWYNSEEQSAARLSQSGINPDLAGLDQASDSTSSDNPGNVTPENSGSVLENGLPSFMSSLGSMVSFIQSVQQIEANQLDLNERKLFGSDSVASAVGSFISSFAPMHQNESGNTPLNEQEFNQYIRNQAAKHWSKDTFGSKKNHKLAMKHLESALASEQTYTDYLSRFGQSGYDRAHGIAQGAHSHDLSSELLQIMDLGLKADLLENEARYYSGMNSRNYHFNQDGELLSKYDMENAKYANRINKNNAAASAFTPGIASNQQTISYYQSGSARDHYYTQKYKDQYDKNANKYMDFLFKRLKSAPSGSLEERYIRWRINRARKDFYGSGNNDFSSISGALMSFVK